MKVYIDILKVVKYLNNRNQNMKQHLKKYDNKAKLQCKQPNLQKNNNIRRARNLIWFNLPFILSVKTNVIKIPLQLIDIHFPALDNSH